MGLARTYAGTRGYTAAQISHTSRFNHLNFNMDPIFRATLGSMNAGQGDYILLVANGLFVDSDYSTVPSFKSFVSKYYSAEFNYLEFIKYPKASAEYINKWIDDKTNGKITDIVDEIFVKDAAVIYFKGKWKRPFDSDNTVIVKFDVSPSDESSDESESAIQVLAEPALALSDPGAAVRRRPTRHVHLAAD